jgi:hypothetical protein
MKAHQPPPHGDTDMTINWTEIIDTNRKAPVEDLILEVLMDKFPTADLAALSQEADLIKLRFFG